MAENTRAAQNEWRVEVQELNLCFFCICSPSFCSERSSYHIVEAIFEVILETTAITFAHKSLTASVGCLDF